MRRSVTFDNGQERTVIIISFETGSLFPALNCTATPRSSFHRPHCHIMGMWGGKI